MFDLDFMSSAISQLKSQFKDPRAGDNFVDLISKKFPVFYERRVVEKEIPQALQQVAKKETRNYALTVSKSFEGDYYISVSLKGKALKKFRDAEDLKPLAEDAVAQEVMKDGLAGQYVDMLRARGPERFEKAKTLQKRLEATFKRTLKKRKAYREYTRRSKESMEAVASFSGKATDDACRLLDGTWRNDLINGKKPHVYIYGDSSASEDLVDVIGERIKGKAKQTSHKKPEDYLKKKKVFAKGALPLAAGAIAVFVGATAYLAYRYRWAGNMAAQKLEEIHNLNMVIDSLQDEMGDAYQGFGGKLQLFFDLMFGRNQELLDRANQLIADSQDKVDLNHNGEIDYTDSNGDGVVDNDLDGDGNPDIDLTNGDILDDDAPINWYALARLLVEDLDYREDWGINLAYADFKEAFANWNSAHFLIDVASSLAVDLDGDGKPDYQITKDEVTGEWSMTGSNDLNGNGVPDLLVTTDAEGNPVYHINDLTALPKFISFMGQAYDNLSDASQQIYDKYLEYVAEYRDKVDLNHNGEIDYTDSNGDGVVDNDLDGDGNPDIDLTNGDILDDDAPINWYALARLLVEDLDYREDWGINLAYADFKEAFANYNQGLDNLETYNNFQAALTSAYQHIQDSQMYKDIVDQKMAAIQVANEAIASYTEEREDFLAQEKNFLKWFTGFKYATAAATAVGTLASALTRKSMAPQYLVSQNLLSVVRAK